MAKLTNEEQYDEVNKSKMILEEIYDEKIDTFAIPFGSSMNYNKETIKVALDIGFKGIFTNQNNSAFFHRENFVYDRIFISMNKVRDLKWLLSRLGLRRNLW